MSAELPTPDVTVEELIEPDDPWHVRFLAGVGEPYVIVANTMRDIFRTFYLTFYWSIRGPVRWREVVSQCHEIGNRSVFFITVVLGFLGMILVFQSGYQAQKILGDLQYLGALFLQILLREFAPTITALMLATRVGTGIAAEIGSMVVTEQVDALRMNSADPIQYLVVPRYLASVVMTISLSLYAVLVCYLAGMITGYTVFDINPRTFYNTLLVGGGDLIMLMAKATAYGIAIPIVSAQAGLAAFGGSEGVGWATTQAVVNSSLAVVFLDFLLSGLGYIFLF